MNWMEVALSRGARQATWKKRPAILIPTDGNTRVIYTDGKLHPELRKYDWEKAGQQQPLWINPAALDTPGETLYIANGDKSTYAHLGIGLENTVGRYGENQPNQIRTQVESLQNSHKRHIIIIPDCDPTGTKDAWYWQQYGEIGGLTVDIRDLRQHRLATPKWDTRDLIEDDPDLAIARLEFLPPFDFDLYPDELPKEAGGNILDLFKPEYKPSESDALTIYDEWWEKEVLKAVNETSKRGIYKPQRCLSGRHKHGDKRPSFRILKSGAPVCHCGTIRKADVAEWWGVISYEDYKSQRRKQDEKNASCIDLATGPDDLPVTVTDTPFSDTSPACIKERGAEMDNLSHLDENSLIYNALPEAVRAVMVKLKHTPFARLVDILLGDGYQPGQVITIPEITPTLAPYFSDRGIAKAVTSNFCTFVNTKKHTLNNYSSQKCKNSKRGRKSVEYLIPTISDLAKTYGVDDGYLPPLPLPPAALESNRAYAAHTMRDIVLPSGVSEKKSGRKIAEAMGVSPTTVSNYRVILESQVEGFEVTPTPPHKEQITVDGIGDKILQALEKAQACETTVWLEAYDEHLQPLTDLKKQKFNPDGTPKPRNNRFPLATGVILRFAEDVATWFICWKQPNTWYNPPRKERYAAAIRFNQFSNPLASPASTAAAAD